MADSDHASLLEAFGNFTEEDLAAHLDSLVKLLGERNFCRKAASHLVLFARPEVAIPGSLCRYAPLVRDGIEFFLSALSFRRLRRVLLSRCLRQDCREPGERLLTLAVFFPTLHKLGQIIARNPHIDPAVRGWLVGLEHGNFGTDPDVQVLSIRRQLALLDSHPDIDISPYILAEASVATVLPFHCRQSGSGVFKILKPGIQDDLPEELDALACTFAFLEENKQRYGLQELKLNSIFREIRGDMAREIDLVSEQKHLAEAGKQYASVAGVVIPKSAPFSTPDMTSMEYINGMKIGEIQLTKHERMVLARRIFETVLCVPLFAQEELALFHGDPHGGNIMVAEGSDRQSHDVVLLDWAQAGHLSKKQRIKVMELLLGIMNNDSRSLAAVIESLALTGEGQEMMDGELLVERIKTLLASSEYLACDPLKKSFLLLETMTLQGIVLPSDLILFRKAFFTLEGVLYDTYQGFAMGEAMENYLARLLMKEFPLRCGTWMIPVNDKAENYQSLLPNKTLQELSLHQSIALWQETVRRSSSLVETNMKLLADFFMYFSGSQYWLGGKGL